MEALCQTKIDSREAKPLCSRQQQTLHARRRTGTGAERSKGPEACVTCASTCDFISVTIIVNSSLRPKRTKRQYTNLTPRYDNMSYMTTKPRRKECQWRARMRITVRYGKKGKRTPVLHGLFSSAQCHFAATCNKTPSPT
jgi:hypothetical protein